MGMYASYPSIGNVTLTKSGSLEAIRRAKDLLSEIESKKDLIVVNLNMSIEGMTFHRVTEKTDLIGSLIKGCSDTVLSITKGVLSSILQKMVHDEVYVILQDEFTFRRSLTGVITYIKLDDIDESEAVAQVKEAMDDPWRIERINYELGRLEIPVALVEVIGGIKLINVF